MASKKIKKRLVFVDDDLDFLKTIRKWQDDFNLQGYATSDIERALNMVRKGGVSVFICDLKMPGQNGISVMQKVRTIDPNIELALLTGYDMTDEEKSTAKDLCAKICLKYEDLKSFLDSLVEITGKKESSIAIKLQEKVSKLEHLNREMMSRTYTDADEFARVRSEKRIESSNLQTKPPNRHLSDFQKAIFRIVNLVLSFILATMAFLLTAQYVKEGFYLIAVFLGMLLFSAVFFELIGRFVFKVCGLEISASSVEKKNNVCQ